jgi:hypothetical protein
MMPAKPTLPTELRAALAAFVDSGETLKRADKGEGLRALWTWCGAMVRHGQRTEAAGKLLSESDEVRKYLFFRAFDEGRWIEPKPAPTTLEFVRFACAVFEIVPAGETISLDRRTAREQLALWLEVRAATAAAQTGLDNLEPAICAAEAAEYSRAAELVRGHVDASRPVLLVERLTSALRAVRRRDTITAEEILVALRDEAQRSTQAAARR